MEFKNEKTYGEFKKRFENKKCCFNCKYLKKDLLNLGDKLSLRVECPKVRLTSDKLSEELHLNENFYCSFFDDICFN